MGNRVSASRSGLKGLWTQTHLFNYGTMQGQAAETFCKCEEMLTEIKFPFVRQRNHRRAASKHHQANLKPEVTALQKEERVNGHKINRRSEHAETTEARLE